MWNPTLLHVAKICTDKIKYLEGIINIDDLEK